MQSLQQFEHWYWTIDWYSDYCAHLIGVIIAIDYVAAADIPYIVDILVECYFDASPDFEFGFKHDFGSHYQDGAIEG